jgi:hypothetical protein
MKINRTRNSLLTSAALAGIISGSIAIKTSAAPPPSRGTILLASNSEPHSCKGRNSCKGQGGCKTGDNGCKGKNSCKGKGGCATQGKATPGNSAPGAKSDTAPKPTANDKLDEAAKHDENMKNAAIMQLRKKTEEMKKRDDAFMEALKKLEDQQKSK